MTTKDFASEGSPAGGRVGERPPLLELVGVKAAYDRVPALHGLDLEVREGEFVALLGPNGAGKTTTLRTISALVRIQAGEVRWQGQRANRWTTTRVTREGIGHVPEARRIFPDHTVEENLQLGGYVLRRDRPALAEALDDVYRLFPRLAERRRQVGGTLSGGEAQMLAVARALMCRPRLLMLDEPSLGLAPMLVGEMFVYLSRLHREHGLTILLVEQAAQVTLKFADRGYVLEHGRVAISGTAAELQSDPQVQRVYLGAGVS